MAFSPSLPADDAKIRDFPQQMRDNFTAIDNGDTSFAPDKLNLSVQGSDPSLLNNAVILYSKDSSSESALYLKNDADDVLQMTDQEYLGGASQKMKAASIRFGAGTIDNNQNAMVNAWGRFNSAGTLSAGYRITTSRDTQGIYSVAFTSAMANTNYAAVATAESNDVKPETATVYAKTVNGFKIQIKDIAEDFKDRACMVIICGGL
jgi:hypothetical protein